MRTYYRRFKKNTSLRQFATPRLVRAVKRVEVSIGDVERQFTSVRHRSKFRAVCHFGMQKTGSVWFREMFSDVRLYRYSGLPFRDCAGRKDNFQIERGIYAPIRVVTDETLGIFRLPDVVKILVVRDPLALLVSWVNSTENYHVSGGSDGGMSQRRAALKKLDFEGKIDFAMDYHLSESIFEKVSASIAAANAAQSATIIRYEDCLDQPKEVFERICREADIKLPDAEIEAFVKEHSFESYSGRKMGGAAPRHSALQGNTRSTVNQLGDKVRTRVLKHVPVELCRLYDT